jgi:A/G-specific adenine glycosylase
MLQQTQVDRVDSKFVDFTAKFPDFKTLAAAPLRSVLAAWQGMGYNRRALYLKNAAIAVVTKHGGALPRTIEELQQLPGIGPATARSIAAYAFNMPVAFIETNIRTVFIHEFFPQATAVSDAAILPLVEQTLDTKDPWTWYNALMDYGTMLKSTQGNISRKSAHYTRQASFAGSDRRIRGEIIRHITSQGALSEQRLCTQLSFPQPRIRACLDGLCSDGLLTRQGRTYRIAD